MDRLNENPIDQMMLQTYAPDVFSDKDRIDLYQSLKPISKSFSDEQRLIEISALPDVRYGSGLPDHYSQDYYDYHGRSQAPPSRRDSGGGSPVIRGQDNYNDGGKGIDCTDEYEVLRENRAHVAEQLAGADRALSDGDLTKFREIFSDPLISKVDRDKFLTAGGEERIADQFGSWIFGETKAQRDAVDAVRNGQGQEGDIKSAADEKLLACEARMLSEEVRAKEQQVEEQRQRKQQEQEESRVEKLIEDIPDIVREAALRGEKAVGVLFLGSAGGYADESLPQLDRLQQKVFDRLAELGLKPSIERMYAEGMTMWVMTANW